MFLKMSSENKDYKVLVVDDRLEVLEAAKKILEKDYTVITISTPKEAINYDKDFDLLISDIYFKKEEKNGFEIILDWRKKKEGLNAILMSSGFDEQTIRLCKKYKILRLEKFKDDLHPIDASELKELVGYYSQRRIEPFLNI